MSAFDLFRYDGKTALVVGGATGMGAATAQAAADAGATVVVMDHAPVEFPVDRAIAVDLQDPASIDAALGVDRRAGRCAVQRGGDRRRAPGGDARELHRPPPPHHPARRSRAGSAAAPRSA